MYTKVNGKKALKNIFITTSTLSMLLCADAQASSRNRSGSSLIETFGKAWVALAPLMNVTNAFNTYGLQQMGGNPGSSNSLINHFENSKTPIHSIQQKLFVADGVNSSSPASNTSTILAASYLSNIGLKQNTTDVLPYNQSHYIYDTQNTSALTPVDNYNSDDETPGLDGEFPVANNRSKANTENNQCQLKEAPAAKDAANQTAANQTAANQTAVNQTAANQTAANQTAVNQTAVNQTVANQTVANQTAANQTVVIVKDDAPTAPLDAANQEEPQADNTPAIAAIIVAGGALLVNEYAAYNEALKEAEEQEEALREEDIVERNNVIQISTTSNNVNIYPKEESLPIAAEPQSYNNAIAQAAEAERLAKEKAKDEAQLIKQADSDPLDTAQKGAQEDIKARLASISTDSMFLSSADLGVASGDEDLSKKKNVWINGLYGYNSQGKVGESAGYKGKLMGGTIGADIEVNERLILGVAYSNIYSIFNYKQNRIGDKTLATNHVLSFYSQAKLQDQIIWKNIVSASLSNAKATNLRNGVVASGKFKNHALSIDSTLGYLITRDNISFLPNIGLRYGISKDSACNETGAGKKNGQIASQSNQTLYGSVGAKVGVKNRFDNGLELIPNLSASIETALMSKAQKVRAKFEFSEDYIKSTADTGAKNQKIAYNIGAGILASKGNIEVSANYNFNLAKKYQAHQGSVKLKLSF